MKSIIILLIAVFASFTSFAQKAKGKSTTSKTAISVQSAYVCPMHADVKSNKPGKCPKCNMDLRLTKKEQMKSDVVDKYTCPMHSDVTSNKGGKCPKCGMALTAKKTKKISPQKRLTL